MGYSALLKISTVVTVPEIFVCSETTLVFALQKLHFGEPVVLCTTVRLSPYRPNKYPVRDAYGVLLWSARWDLNPPPSESESDTLSK